MTPWGWIAGALALALVGVGPRLRRRWLDRAIRDPRRDPGAARGALRRVALDGLLARPLSPTDLVDEVLDLCAVDDRYWWRGGVHRLAGRVGALPRDPDGDALRAEVALALGRFDDAREVVAALPADHWRACSVRAALYELDGDVDRAESAGVAAIHLAPPARRPALTRRLTALRTRHRRTVSPPLTLWERPPQDP